MLFRKMEKMLTALYLSERQPSRSQRFVEHLNRRWVLWFSVFYGLFVGLPFLAPLLMHLGIVRPLTRV